MDTMLITALDGFIGLIRQLFTNLLGKDAELWGDELKKFLRKEPCWLSPATNAMNVVATVAEKAKTAILDFVQTITIPLTTEKFVAGRNFLLKRDGGICSYLGDNFRHWFLEGDGKVEEPRAETVLRCHKLRKNSVDTPIIVELGGEEVAETTLAEVFALLQKQANCKKGILLANGYANIFYIRDQFGFLRAVYVDWYGDGWCVDAVAVTDPYAWCAGGQVFSRDPSATL
jgi:hypothetical protein